MLFPARKHLFLSAHLFSIGLSRRECRWAKRAALSYEDFCEARLLQFIHGYTQASSSHSKLEGGAHSQARQYENDLSAKAAGKVAIEAKNTAQRFHSLPQAEEAALTDRIRVADWNSVCERSERTAWSLWCGI